VPNLPPLKTCGLLKKLNLLVYLITVCNQMYIFYGIEIPKGWTKWLEATIAEEEDKDPITLRGMDRGQEWEVDVPVVGGEPVLRGGKGVRVNIGELTLYRYPRESDSVWEENAGIIGYLICEMDMYSDPTMAIEQYNRWRKLMNKPKEALNVDLTLQEMCRALNFTIVKPVYITTD
jgi:hypothetical protein